MVTGIGVLSCVGIGKENFWDSVKLGQSGIKRITRFDSSNLSVQIAGEVKNFDPTLFMERKLTRRTDRLEQYGIAATDLAIQDARIDLGKIDAERTAVFMGTAIAGGEMIEKQHLLYIEKGPRRISPFLSTAFYNDACAAQIAIMFGLKGGSVTVSGACASSATSIAYARDRIREGHLDVIFAGGVETPIIGMFIAAVSKTGAMSTRNDEPEKASRPFDAGRSGFVLSEGSCVLVLEELEHALARGACIYAELAGVGMTTDAYSMTSPNPDVIQSSRAIQMALSDANFGWENFREIDYINAHGSSTLLNDIVETKMIKEVFSKRAYGIPISSTKSIYGHSMGAAGAMDLAVCCLAIKNSIIPPTINYVVVDPECDLDYVPNVTRKANLEWVLSNAFGFGGHNTCIVLQKPRDR